VVLERDRGSPDFANWEDATARLRRVMHHISPSPSNTLVPSACSELGDLHCQDDCVGPRSVGSHKLAARVRERVRRCRCQKRGKGPSTLPAVALAACQCRRRPVDHRPRTVCAVNRTAQQPNRVDTVGFGPPPLGNASAVQAVRAVRATLALGAGSAFQAARAVRTTLALRPSGPWGPAAPSSPSPPSPS
jgi:hypothetical protein